MKDIQAYKCSLCDFIDTAKSRVVSHEKKCKRNHAKYQAEEKRRKETAEISNEVRLNLTDINALKDEINTWFKKHFPKCPKAFEITLVDLKKLSLISCSHDAPVGAKTKWGRSNKNDGTPSKYLGWEGNIKFKFVERKGLKDHPLDSSWHRDHHPIVRGVHTGSGGGGGGMLSYSIKIFIDDFPLLKEKFIKDCLPLLAINAENKARTRQAAFKHEQGQKQAMRDNQQLFDDIDQKIQHLITTRNNLIKTVKNSVKRHEPELLSFDKEEAREVTKDLITDIDDCFTIAEDPTVEQYLKDYLSDLTLK